MKDLKLFVPITKIDEEQRLVYGVLAEEALDKEGEIFDYDTSKPLFAAWSDGFAKTTEGKSRGNLRAMHQPIAAGKFTEVGFNDDAKRIEVAAKVVDANEWAKVREGVYTGFSIGGHYEKTWRDETAGGTRYTARPAEGSLVDNPCMPGATFTAIKTDGSSEVRKFRKTGVLGADDDTETDEPEQEEESPREEPAPAADAPDEAEPDAGVIGEETSKIIKHEGDEWVLYSSDGSKVLGRHKTKEAAEAQERAIQANKVANDGISAAAAASDLEPPEKTILSTLSTLTSGQAELAKAVQELAGKALDEGALAKLEAAAEEAKKSLEAIETRIKKLEDQPGPVGRRVEKRLGHDLSADPTVEHDLAVKAEEAFKSLAAAGLGKDELAALRLRTAVALGRRTQ